jgi:hypothetical protein
MVSDRELEDRPYQPLRVKPVGGLGECPPGIRHLEAGQFSGRGTAHACLLGRTCQHSGSCAGVSSTS